jgi:hypothetical protein
MRKTRTENHVEDLIREREGIILHVDLRIILVTFGITVTPCQDFPTELTACFLRVPCFRYSSNLKLGAKCTSETSDGPNMAAYCRTPDDPSLHSHCCENLKFRQCSIFF